jgi:nitrite reductase/ring-hydroxylating ferredoxin subunit
MRRLFDSAALPARGSLRFSLGGEREGFALRMDDGSVRGFVNVCPHRGQPVDVGDGRLFLGDGSIECQAHGARFDARSGRCLGGPCTEGLTRLSLQERNGAVWLRVPKEEERPSLGGVLLDLAEDWIDDD